MRRAPPQALALGPLDSLLGYRLRIAQLAVYEDFLGDAPVRGLAPGQFAILVLVHENPETTQQGLCEGIGVDKSTFAIALDRLAERGLIRRIRSKEDRRSNWLRLTARGDAARKAMLRHAARHEKRAFARLSLGERKTLMTLLRKVVPQKD
ncbi:MAG: MarR family winged helix-turn-helix transcriptional regulator [Polyangiaceae bacterium]